MTKQSASIKKRIAMTSTGKTLEDPIDMRFGRCPYYLLIESDDSVKAISNCARNAGGGAGIQAAQQVVNEDVDVVITGEIGPNAFQVLSAANIEIVLASPGRGTEILKEYRLNRLARAEAETHPGHHRMRMRGGIYRAGPP
jgi:predicted Fe-Mo cluster-binding NifX family protein